MAKDEKAVDCPLCAHGDYMDGSVYASREGTAFLGIPIKVIHERHKGVIPGIMRCPLCFGTAKVFPELAAAYRLKYGDERAHYQDIEKLRKEFRQKKL